MRVQQIKLVMPLEVRANSCILHSEDRTCILYPPGYFSDGPKSSSFWQLDYYQPYFDVDTKTVSRVHTHLAGYSDSSPSPLM